MPTLTEDQKESWRNILYVTIGPYARLMTDETLQGIVDRMETINKPKQAQ